MQPEAVLTLLYNSANHPGSCFVATDYGGRGRGEGQPSSRGPPKLHGGELATPPPSPRDPLTVQEHQYMTILYIIMHHTCIILIISSH